MSKVIVIGGGPAGMFAAYFAAKNGHKVTLLEQNEKLGKKLYITGKGRCNITNAADMEELFQNVCSNPKFLYSAFYSYTNDQVVDFFESYGLRTKVERGNRVYPQSDRASDITNGLKRELERLGVRMRFDTSAAHLLIHDGTCSGVVLEGGERILSDAVIICTQDRMHMEPARLA